MASESIDNGQGASGSGTLAAGKPAEVPPMLAAIGVTNFVLPKDARGPERWLWRALIAVLCLLAYAPSFQGEFLWDDEAHAANWRLRQPGGLQHIWTGIGTRDGGTPQYYPLTHTTFWVEYQVFGRNPLGYRVVNALLHAASGVVLWELLRRLRMPGAFVAAALWALHPVNVESVAWVSERKNVLSGLLALGCVFAFLRYARLDSEHESPGAEIKPDSSNPLEWPGGDERIYFISLALFVLACLSKTVVCMVPVALVVLLWWRDALRPALVGRLVPMLVAGAALGLLTSYIERTYIIRTEEAADWGLGLKGRGLIAASALWFYLGKLVLPVNQMFFYPRWEIVETMGLGWAAAGGVVVTLAGLAFWAVRSKQSRGPLAAGLMYGILLFPALGFFKVYPQRYSWVADHFQYHATMVMLPALVAGAIGLWGWRLARKSDSGAGALAAVVLVMAAAALTWTYAFTFRSNRAIFERVVERNPTSWAARQNLGVDLVERSNFAVRVSEQLRRENNPSKAAEGEVEARDLLTKAKAEFETVLQLRPQHEWAHYWLGEVAYLSGDRKAAKAYYLASLDQRKGDRDGEYIPTLSRLAEIAEREKNPVDASEYLKRALAAEKQPIQMPLASTRIRLVRLWALIAREQGRPLTVREAKASYELMQSAASLRLGLDTILGVGDAAKTYADSAKIEGDVPKSEEMYRAAIRAYQQAAQFDPNNTDALYGLGLTLATIRLYDDAALALEQAVKLRPDRKDLGQLLAMVKDVRQRATTNPSLRPATRASGGTSQPSVP